MDNENVKKEWKKAGSDLGHAFAGLGKMLIRTAKVGMEKNLPGGPVTRDCPVFSVYFCSACGSSVNSANARPNSSAAKARIRAQ